MADGLDLDIGSLVDSILGERARMERSETGAPDTTSQSSGGIAPSMLDALLGMTTALPSWSRRKEISKLPPPVHQAKYKSPEMHQLSPKRDILPEEEGVKNGPYNPGSYCYHG